MIFTALFSLLFIQSVLSDKPCGGHELKINYIRNCKGKSGQNNNLQLQNLTVTLTDDCKVVPRGCFVIKKKVTSANVDYFVTKPPMFNKNGTEELCKAMSDPKFQSMVSKLKTMDSKCPIEAGKYCLTKGDVYIDKLNPSILNMAIGTIRAMASFTSDTVKEKTCVEMEAVVSKKR